MTFFADLPLELASTADEYALLQTILNRAYVLNWDLNQTKAAMEQALAEYRSDKFNAMKRLLGGGR